jgi:hypothetical protein
MYGKTAPGTRGKSLKSRSLLGKSGDLAALVRRLVFDYLVLCDPIWIGFSQAKSGFDIV